MLASVPAALAHGPARGRSQGMMGGRLIGMWLLFSALSSFIEPALDVLGGLHLGVSAIDQLRKRMEAESQAAYVVKHDMHNCSRIACSLSDVPTVRVFSSPCLEGLPHSDCVSISYTVAAGNSGGGTGSGCRSGSAASSCGSGSGTSGTYRTDGGTSGGTYRTDRKRKDQTAAASRAGKVQHCAITCGCGKTWTAQEFNGHRCTGRIRQPALVAMPEETAADMLDANAHTECMDIDVTNIQAKYLETCQALHLKHYVPTAAVQLAKTGFHTISKLTGAAIQRALRDIEDPSDISAMIGPIINAVDPLLSKYNEDTRSSAMYKYPIVPVPRKLGTVQETVLVGAAQREVTRERDVIMYDIPLEKILQRELYYNPGFAEHFVDWGELPTTPGVYADIQDGSAAKSHPMLGDLNYCGPSRLGFGHYNDGCEIAGPLGAARGKFKVELHYVVVYNQPNHIRSRLDQIFLVGVALASDQKEVGSSLVVQGPPEEPYHGSSLGAAMRRLDHPDGVIFQVPDGCGGFKSQPFRGWLLAVSADTLGAAELIGTKKGFSDKTVSPCYQCNAMRGEHACANSFLQETSKFKLRTDDVYASQLAFADTRPLTITKPRQPRCPPGAPKPPPLPPLPPCTHGDSCRCTRAEYMASIGVNTFNHSYTRIPHFRAMSSFPRDVMHIECTGSSNLPHHAYAFLYMGIKLKWFTRLQVNRAIKQAQCSHFRVPCIQKVTLKGRKGNLPCGKGHLSFTAGQMLQFALHSVEIFRPLVPQAAQSHPIWKAWVAHTRYFQACMKTSFTTTEVHQLDSLINKAQRLFLDIPEYSKMWKPKSHFAQHIPPDIFMFGPPRGVWCMRFEAKNYEHKKAAKLGNWLEIPRQIAKFWARRTAFLLKFEPPEFAPSVRLGEEQGTELLNPTLSLEHKLYFEAMPSTSQPTPSLSWLSSITYLGHDIEVGTWLVVCSEDESFPAHIAVVQSLFHVDGVAHLHIWRVNKPLQQGKDGVPYAKEEDLESETGGMLQNIVADSSNSITVSVLVSTLLDGKRRFIEVP
jgi:hypothetical protein